MKLHVKELHFSETVNEKTCVWEAALSLLLDNEEASVVRENAAALLTNLCSHIFAGVNVQNVSKISKFGAGFVR